MGAFRVNEDSKGDRGKPRDCGVPDVSDDAELKSSPELKREYHTGAYHKTVSMSIVIVWYMIRTARISWVRQRKKKI
jgi:hypothetical protein